VARLGLTHNRIARPVCNDEIGWRVGVHQRAGVMGSPHERPPAQPGGGSGTGQLVVSTPHVFEPTLPSAARPWWA
jgi:hypothetical protein